MKIVHKSKRPTPPPPQVAEFINTLVKASNEELVDILADVDAWKWPRSDLNSWVKVLNKFDQILEENIAEYELDALQLKPFSPAAKRVISEILRFERLLMENSTNRKTYSSYDRLNSLLFTSDLDILVLTLNLLLRPAQQYSAQPAVSHALSLSSGRLQSLAKKWPHVRENGVSLADLVSTKGEAEVESLPVEAREVNMTFYRTDAVENEEHKPEAAAAAMPETPRKDAAPTSATSTGAVAVHIDEIDVLAKPAIEVLGDAIKAFGIPEKEKFEVFSRIRISASLEKGHREEREKLLIARLLAIAIYCHTHPESRTSSTLFVYEPDLITHIAELLQVDNGVPISVQTAAIATLDALARYRARLPEVLTAVNAAINHGILMGLFRKTVNDLPHADANIPHTFVEALLGFMTYIVSHQSGSSMVVGAGLIPLLIQLIDNKSPSRLATISKTTQLLDTVLYSSPNGFQLFTASRGLETLVERIEYEVDYDIQNGGERSKAATSENDELPIARVAVLKHMLRSMHRMMQASGTAEGLRNLINMSLLKTIKRIIEYRGLFGPMIFPFAINIMTTFVHNEPTSLTVIQEAGLPEAFYNAIEAGIETAIEVIQAIPNAIGALCLNEVGQTQLAKRPSIIPSIFALFTSERHLKVLNDKENSVMVGTAIDELIRHHPSLKAPVFSALKSTLIRIEELGMEYEVPANIRQWYHLRPLRSEPAPASASDVPMDVDEPKEGISVDTSESSEEDENNKSHDSIIVSYIDILGRFLEGLFQHTPHCKDFITLTDGLNRLGRITGLPCFPYDFANSVPSDSLVQVMRTMAEVSTNETLQHLSRLVKESLEETEAFWQEGSPESKLLSLVDVSEENYEQADADFRKLTTLLIRVTMLSDVFSTTGYAHGRAAIGLLQTLMNNTSPEVIASLGTLHRAAIWEEIVFNAGIAAKGIDLALSQTPPSSGVQDIMDLDSGERTETSPANVITATTNGVQPEQASGGAAAAQPTTASSHSHEPRTANAAAIRHITQGLPNTLAPFFQAMVKTFHARRNPDTAQRKQIQESSKIVADVVLKHFDYDIGNDSKLTFEYYNSIIRLFNQLLIEERPSSTILHTIELFAFYRIGGLEALFRVSGLFTARITEISAKPEDSRSDVEVRDLDRAYTGLNLVLSLLHPILSAKLIVESGQSHLIATKDKKDTEADYFEPHNFLIKLRVAALPLIHSLWTAPWLQQANMTSVGLSVTRAVVRTVLEVLKGDGEETRADGTVEVPQPYAPRPPGPDETRVHLLTDMGFPRSAAERALIRMNNNVNAATEFLLAHPFPLPPDPEPEAAAPSVDTPAEEATAEAPPPVTTEGAAADQTETPIEPAAAESTQEPVIQEEDTSPPGKTTEEWRKILNDGREDLTATLSQRALTLIDNHQQLLFDLYPAFTKTSPMQQQSILQLVEDVKNFSPQAYDVQETPLANRCRLLALVICESPSALDDELQNKLMDHLLALLSSIVVETPPKWLAGHLLVLEALFTLSDQPKTISLPKEGEPIPVESIAVGPPRTEARRSVFKLCLRLLSVDELKSDDLLSVLRLFVLFTRDQTLANRFIGDDGLNLLFKRLRSTSVDGASSYIATILRHLVEDPATIRTIMQQNIKRYFSQLRTHVVDVGTYVKSCSSMALRDSEIFIDATKSICQLNQPYGTANRISLQPDKDAAAQKNDKTDETVDMHVDPIPATTTSGTAEATVHLLVSELISSVKDLNESSVDLDDAEATPTSGSGNATDGAGNDAAQQSSEQKAKRQGEIQDKYQYVCFIMQCLAELLLSYDSCKNAFLSYSPKRKTQTPAKEPGTRFRNATIQFLLSDLLTFGTINPQSNSKLRNKMTLCNWAMTVIIALCADSSSPSAGKDASSDLMSVRKYVLEAIGRTIKDLPTSDNLDSKYGRLLALAELCNRMLTIRFDNTPAHRKPAEVLSQIAKVMLEKNFVSTLTSSLSDIDLNYPYVKSVVSAVLKPLQYLTKVSIKMSRTGKGKQDHHGDDSGSESSSSADDDEEFEEQRGETPDLYRNSSLGMYSGEMDDSRYSQDEEMDEDAGDTDDDVEMEFADETGSEDTSNTDDDEDEDDEDMDEEHASEDGWDEGVDEDEEALVENEEENEEDEEEPLDDEGDDDVGDDDEDEGEGELIWEGVDEDAEGLEAIRDEFEEEEETGVPVQIIHEDDVDGESDEEQGMDPNIFNLENALNFSQVVNANGGELPSAFYMPRRGRGAIDEAMHYFGRHRNLPVGSTPETTVHPLLLNTASQNRPAASQSRSRHHPQRIIASGQGAAGLLQTLDGMMGPGSFQVIQQIVAPGHRGPFPDGFRFDLPAFVNLEARGPAPSRRGHAMVGGAFRIEHRATHPSGTRNGREFEPLLTLQRWAEETKILHGDFVTERAAKLVNHVILALLPSAIEAAKQAKIRELEEAARIEREKAEAEAEAASASAKEKATDGEVMATESVQETPAQEVTPPEQVSQAQPAEASSSEPEEITAAPPADAIMAEDQGAVNDAVMVDVQPSAEQPVADDAQPAQVEATTSTAAQQERITVTIHGNVVDITDTGIDPDFLEALPDDMREEVLNQHVRDQRAARVERPADSQISSEFLDALPPEIRAEILQQEAIERARRQAEDTTPARGPVEIDAASFIASLDPTLRQAVLLEQEDGFLQSLPAHILAEAEGYREDIQQRPRHRLTTRTRQIPPGSQSHPGDKAKTQHNALQLLDKSGVAILIRLLFFPKVLRKSLLFRIFVNLCQNAKTRTELFNFLLSILQDGTRDLAAVDKSFAQMSVRSSKPQTPKSVGKQKVGPDYLSALSLPPSQIEAFPDLVAKKCLDALTYIVTANSHASLFFLTEHELGLRKTTIKKGKGKEKQAPQSHYPIVLLLGLLDRKPILQTPAILDSVVNLLASVTRPLSELKDRPVDLPSDAPATSAQTETNVPAPAASSSVSASNVGEIAQAAPEPQPTSEPTPQNTADSGAKIETVEEKLLLANPPQIPHAALRFIVNILTIGECPAKTFQQSMNLIQNLSHISDARDVIAQELKAKAQEFGRTLIGDIDQLMNTLQSQNADSMTSCIATKFSPASSTQAKLLRVLKTIEHMYSSKTTSDPQKKEQDVEKVQGIYESFNFSSLWQKLGECLSLIADNPDTEHIATVLLPLIESLMVVCQHVGSKVQSSRILSGAMSPRSPTTPRESMESLFIMFTDTHRKLLNLMVRNNPSLMSGSFSLLVNNPRVLDFDNKRNYFNQQLHRRPTNERGEREHRHTLPLNVRRARVFEDSFQHLQRKTGDQIKYGKLNVRFYDEEGVDAGGVSREWFQILARQMFDPNNALFQPCAADKQTYQPNKNSWVNPEHLSFFKFVGRVIGKAIYDGRLLDAYFAKSLYRQLLGKPVDYRDVEWVDPEYYKSLCWILENDPTLLELTFSVEADEFGVNRIIPLKEGGEHIPVTLENRTEFVQLSARYRLYSSIKDQIESLSGGFYEIIPKDLITIFNEQELELLISGTPDIDVDEWRAATDYVGYTSSDPNIVWWWRALKSFNRDERAKVLSFATGTSRVPLNGFTDLQGVQGVQRFSIHRAYGENDRLPQAHTCFNQIDLPQYSTYEMLRQQLLMAINEGGEGFAFS